jgi:hypothetical protein
LGMLSKNKLQIKMPRISFLRKLNCLQNIRMGILYC